MGELRRQAEASLGLDSKLQRWIVGRTLCLNDSTPLATLAGPDLSAPFYLCIVESGMSSLIIISRNLKILLLIWIINIFNGLEGH